MVLSKSEIKKADDFEIEIVEVPEWNGEVGVKTMSGKERDEFDQTMYDKSGSAEGEIGDIRGLKVELLIRTCCDEDGELRFDEDDKEMLSGKSARAIDRLFTKAQELNGLTAEDVEDLAGN